MSSNTILISDNQVSFSYVELCKEIERHKRMAELWQLNYELALLILEGLYDERYT